MIVRRKRFQTPSTFWKLLSPILKLIIKICSPLFLVVNYILRIVIKGVHLFAKQISIEHWANLRMEDRYNLSYPEWEHEANRLDELKGNTSWKSVPESPYYDHDLLKLRIEHIKQIAIRQDVSAMMYLLRAGLIRNLGGLANPFLYKKCFVGTKVLIEDYINEVVKQLYWIADYGQKSDRSFSDPIASFMMKSPLQVGSGLDTSSEMTEPKDVLISPINHMLPFEPIQMKPKPKSGKSLQPTEGDGRSNNFLSEPLPASIIGSNTAPAPAASTTTVATKSKVFSRILPKTTQATNKTNASNVHFFTPQAKYEYFAESLQSFGRTAFVATGGIVLGVYHLGVAKALFEQSILPWILCGYGLGGALISSFICTKTPEELFAFFQKPAVQLDYSSVEKMGDHSSIKIKLLRLLKEGHLIDIKALQSFSQDNLGNITFAEAYAKSHRILNILVRSKKKRGASFLLNHISAPDVIIWSAAIASGSSSGVCEAVALLVKSSTGAILPLNPSEIHWSDGFQGGELPFSRLAELFNVNNYIISKIVPYHFTLLEYLCPRTPVPSSASIITKISGFLIGECKHFFHQLGQLGFLPTILESWFLQPQSSNVHSNDLFIVISPTIEISDIYRALLSPNAVTFDFNIRRGQAATWPELSQLMVRLKIETAIEHILKQLTLSSPELLPIFERLNKEISSKNNEATKSGQVYTHWKKRTKSLF